jgi:hypothetical protein
MVTNTLRHILTEARRGFTTKSDLARLYADEVAVAASKGWISTEVYSDDDWYSNVWQITARGLIALKDKHYATQKQA